MSKVRNKRKERRKVQLTRAERKQIEQIKAQVAKPKYPQSAQQTIPYLRMYPDGICRVTEKLYSKTVRFFDINYQQAQDSDKDAIFGGWSGIQNFYQPGVFIQYSYPNIKTNEEEFEKNLIMAPREDGHNDVRDEMTGVLMGQVEKGNNAIERTKYATIAIEADSLRSAKVRLEQTELQMLNHYKRLGIRGEPMDGKQRLELLYRILHMDDPQSAFHFDWKWLPASGLSTKDFIAPSSLYFKDPHRFYIGKKMATVSYLHILAAELDDRVLVDFLNMETTQVVTMHIQSIDHVEAIKMVKHKLTDLNRSKIDEQKKAVRSGYDIDILPSDLNTYTTDFNAMLQSLTSHNERLFLMTFTILHTGDTRKELDSVIMQAKGIAQEKLCQLIPLDYQQEEGFVSALPLGLNKVEIQRTMTTSGVAIFLPFITQELFQRDPEALYYGLNALTNNLIMANRKSLKNPNGLILGTPGCFSGDTAISMADESYRTFAELVERGITEADVCAYDAVNHCIVRTRAKDIRIEKYVNELCVLNFSDTSIRCTGSHQIMMENGQYIEARSIKPGMKLSGNKTVQSVERQHYDAPVPVYDMGVPYFRNFVLACGLVVHNSGKSFSAKREIANVFLATQDHIMICDPEGEYYPLVNRLKGQVIRISPTSTDYINPLDINVNYSDGDDPIRLKSDFILSLCELVLGEQEGVGAQQKSIIDRALREIYKPFFADPVPEKMPILGDLYNKLRSMEEPEAAEVATALELYVTGSLNVFNHQTNVELNNRLVCYDIKHLGQNLKKLGMLIVQDQVWNRVTINRAQRRSTWYYMDEFHLLLREPQTAAYSIEIWKRFRKWGGVPTGITQNVKDLLISREVESIFENSEFIMMLNQAPGDSAELAKRLHISDHQLSHVTQAGEGEGLLFFGNVIIPFVDRFPKDTELYRIMTTKPSEMLKEDEAE